MEGEEDGKGVGETIWPGLWKNIWVRSQFLQKCVIWKVGRGKKVLFGHVIWLEEGRLKDQWPQIFTIAQTKNTMIMDAYEGDELRREWTVNVTRNINDWELEEYEALLQLLTTAHLNINGDQLVWTLDEWLIHGQSLVQSFNE